jgi:CheY-like chemotaxis protein
MTGGLRGLKPEILVVEDNPGDVTLLKIALENAGVDCELTVMGDGGEALAYVQQLGAKSCPVAPDLVLLDLNLPKNDGIEILNILRRNPSFTEVPVVILTSSCSPRELARIEGLQITRHITKPLDFDEYLKIGFILKDLLAKRTIHGALTGT